MTGVGGLGRLGSGLTGLTIGLGCFCRVLSMGFWAGWGLTTGLGG